VPLFIPDQDDEHKTVLAENALKAFKVPRQRDRSSL